MRFAAIDVPKPSYVISCLTHERSTVLAQSRAVPEETPVALVYGGSTEAVMMATPADLEDFAIGFSLTERLIEGPDEISDLSVVYGDVGVELRMWLAGERAEAYRNRRRKLTAPTGCGLCGIESLAEAVRPSRRVSDGIEVHPRHIAEAVAALERNQHLSRETGAMHAAGFYVPDGSAAMVREDVGRHNALDKLAGFIARNGGIDPSKGVIVITSRVSVEMVQKAACIGAPVLVAMSAPTALAVRTAAAANLTLIALARHDSFQIFSGSHRLARRP